jgi:hypothetical protein
LRRDIVSLLFAHYARPHTKLLTVPARGVSINAGKYLLKSIYAKTSLSNQAALVALLREAPLGWGMPITGLPA